MLHLIVGIVIGRIKTDAGATASSSVALSVWPGYTLGRQSTDTDLKAVRSMPQSPHLAQTWVCRIWLIRDSANAVHAVPPDSGQADL